MQSMQPCIITPLSTASSIRMVSTITSTQQEERVGSQAAPARPATEQSVSALESKLHLPPSSNGSPSCNSNLNQNENIQQQCKGEHNSNAKNENENENPSQPEKRKRWKKPAIRKKRRFGLEISLNMNASNVGYYPSSDEDGNDDGANHNVWDQSHPDELAKDFFSTSAPDRRERKKRSLFQPEDTRDTAPQKHKKKAKGRGRPRGSSTLVDQNHAKGKNNPKIKVNSKLSISSPPPSAVEQAHPHGTRSATKISLLESTAHGKSKSKSKSKKKKSKPSSTSSTKTKTKSFDQRLEDLKVFTQEFGHSEVPYTYEPNQPLSNWVSNVRYSYGLVQKGLTPTIKMTKERIASLREIGFDFKFGVGKKGGK
jgi:hypothetical protein